MHAPFGEDPDRPMHVVHEDVVTPRMHTVGFNWRGDLELPFPQWLWHPRVYQSFDISRSIVSATACTTRGSASAWARRWPRPTGS